MLLFSFIFCIYADKLHLKPMPRRFVILQSILLLFFCWGELCAIKSPGRASYYKQPDGSIIQVVIKGDEFFSYKTSSDGFIIAMGADGFYYYADYDDGYLYISDHGVSHKGSVKSENYDLLYQKRSFIPQNVMNSIREERVIKYRGDERGQIISHNTKIIENQAPTKYKVLVIPAQFSDKSFSVINPQSHFNELVRGDNYTKNGAVGSVKEYFTENLSSVYDFEFELSEIVTLDKPYSYYGENSSTGEDYRPREMIVDACRAAYSAGTDFSKFDNNADGVVDFVFVFFAGHNEAEGGGDNTIWPHGWDILSLNLTLNGVKIGKYACSSELRGDNTSNEASGIGTFCHEFGHILGLPDLYDTDGQMNGLGTALFGKLSLMDEGCYNNNGHTPPNLSALEREIIGTGGGHICSSPGQYPVSNEYQFNLFPLVQYNRWLRINTRNKDEYFLIELRNRAGRDYYLEGEGVLIYHIDRSDNIVSGATASERWDYNIINTYARHQCAFVVPANGGYTFSDLSDLFFTNQGNNTFTLESTPAMVGWNGESAELGISIMDITDQQAILTLAASFGSRMPRVVDHSVITTQREAIINWKTDINYDALWGIAYREKGASKMALIGTRENDYIIDYLTPGVEYECKLFTDPYTYRPGMDTLKFDFKTFDVTSPYPFIPNIKRVYDKGEVIELSVLNINEDVDSIFWYVDGVKIDGNSYKAVREGLIEIRADIQYSRDNSIESIRKCFKVE